MNTFTQRSLLNKLRDAKKRQKQNGFTLVELLIVVIILGVLTSVALPSLLGTRDKADKNASFSSVLGMAQECANALLVESTPPAFATNKLVTVTGNCASTGTGVTYATNVDQDAPEGKLCINTPVSADMVTGNTNDTCTVTVDANGGKTGAWS